MYPSVIKVFFYDPKGSFHLDGTVYPQQDPCFALEPGFVVLLQFQIMQVLRDAFVALRFFSAPHLLALLPVAAIAAFFTFVDFEFLYIAVFIGPCISFPA